VFLPESSNEAKVLDRLGADIKKVQELGFLRKLKGQTDTYEVARILKAYVDAQWLEEFDARLADYRATLAGEPPAAERAAAERVAAERRAESQEEGK
jgi:hypothetical protein